MEEPVQDAVGRLRWPSAALGGARAAGGEAGGVGDAAFSQTDRVADDELCQRRAVSPSRVRQLFHQLTHVAVPDNGKGKGFPYSTPSAGPGADPGVQAVSLQVTASHPPGGRLPLLSARPTVTSPGAEHHRLGRYQVILLGDRGK